MRLTHCSVLLEQAVGELIWTPDGTYVDGTFGRGGHSGLILNKLSEKGRLLAIDKDPTAVALALSWRDHRFKIEHGSFGDLSLIVKKHAFGHLAGILLDLGVSSPQLEDPARGFSFRYDGPLDMRMNPLIGVSAQEWLLQASEKEIAEVIFYYGEERYANKIARAIVARRQELSKYGESIESTFELAEIVAKVVRRVNRKHPATKTFQAIRIHINQELNDLERCLHSCIDLLMPGGRLVVLSFHSLEDRIVKSFIRSKLGNTSSSLKGLGKVRVTEEEKRKNIRARSAIMRIAEKVCPVAK